MEQLSRTRAGLWFAKSVVVVLLVCAPLAHAQMMEFEAAPLVVEVSGTNSTTGYGSDDPDDPDGPDGSSMAISAAVADGVSTGLALSAGAVEMNPLIMTSPLGLVAMTGLKIGLIKYAETLPEDEKRATMKASSAVWGGAALNNLLVLMAVPSPVGILAGILMGVATWVHMDQQYQEHDRLAALRDAAMLQAAAVVADDAIVAELAGGHSGSE